MKFLLKKSIILILSLTSFCSFSFEQVTIKSGQTLWEIANENKVNNFTTQEMIESIKKINNLKNTIIKKGQVLTIPQTKEEMNNILTKKINIQELPKNVDVKDFDTSIFNEKILNLSDINEELNKKIEKLLEINKDLSEENQQIQTNLHSYQQSIQKQMSELNIKNNKLMQELNNKSSNQKTNKILLLLLVLFIFISFILLIRNLKIKNNFRSSIKEYEDQIKLDRIRFNKLVKKFERMESEEDYEEEQNKFHKEDLIRDKIEEAASFIDNQDFDAAKTILNNILKEVPHDVSSRILLLEVSAKTNDLSQFIKIRTYLENVISSDEEIWQDIDTLYEDYFNNK